MATIRPFRGLRYNLPNADAAKLLAPPYDVVDAELRASLAARSPDNCVHVILPEGAGDAKYERGAQEFRRLLRDGALLRDERPGIYVYHQQFSAEGRSYTRKGFICLIELSSFGDGPVLPHERTLKGPKEDRLKLMRACSAHLELVFGMFTDPERSWEAAVDGQLGAPVLEADFDGSHHRLFRVSDAGAIAALRELLAERSIYIADGHHRYETMCSFRSELERAGEVDADAARFGMIYLSNLNDPGLVVLPTHRIVHGVQGLDVAGTVASLNNIFSVERAPLPADAASLRAILKDAGAERAAFALSLPGSGEMTVLTLKQGFDPAQAGLGGLPPALQRLDVVLLHELVLDRGFGISREAQAAKTNIRYYKSSEAALALARDREPGDAQVVCFMNATPVEDVVAVCDSGEVMPQKSTFFYPKIPTGLTFHSLLPER